MRPTWLIESDVYGDEALSLVNEIRRQGLTVETLPYSRLKTGSPVSINGSELVADHCVVGYGSYPFCQQILIHRGWRPGAWCNSKELDCANYYPHFERDLLNRDCLILPGVEAIRRRDELFDRFGVGGRVFARPTSCHKIFVGRILDRDSFATALAPTRYDPDTQIVVARPQPIEREWRLVIVNSHVVAGSQYALHGERAIKADCPAEVMAFAEGILNRVSWRPDPAFMIDVCESAGLLRLVELNSFGGSWFYQCDLAAVVGAASELAESIWKQDPRPS
jgi:hypothetical protein